MRPHLSSGVLRLWSKVVLSLIAIDVLLFRVGLMWQITPNFGTGLGAENWTFLYDAAREFETQRAAPGKTEVAGSSVVIFGADQAVIDPRLHAAGAPPMLRLATHGSTATDTALLVWNSLPTHPWLVIYGAAYRDFPKVLPGDTRIIRTFYDSSAELAAVPRNGTEQVLDARVKRYWKLYRYRFFASTVARTLLDDLTLHAILPRPAAAVSWLDLPPAPPVPAEALQYFAPYRVTEKSWAVWNKWRRTRQFADYLEWLKLGSAMALNNYKTQTMEAFGPKDNPQVESFRWMLDSLQQDHTRTVIVYFPENPVFTHDPASLGYYHPFVSGSYAELFKNEADTHGARFVDLRDFVEAEGFYDMIHLNNVGTRKVSERLAQLIQEEWQLYQSARSSTGRP